MTDLIIDTFTGTNGTHLNAHTPDTNTPGHAWVEQVGSWTIQSNQATTTSITQPQATIDAGVSDCILTLDVYLISTSVRTGIMGRWSSSGNYWELGLRVGTQLMELIEFISGTANVRASIGVSLAAGQTHTLQLTMLGTSLTGTMDGANTISYVSSSYQTKTLHGLRGTNTVTGETWDNFKVQTSGTTSYTLTAAQGSFSLTWQAAILSSARKMAAAQAAYTLTGKAAILSSARKMAAAQGSFSLTGKNVGLTFYHLGYYTMIVSPGYFTFTGFPVTLKYGFAVVSPTGAGQYIYRANKRGNLNSNERNTYKSKTREQ